MRGLGRYIVLNNFMNSPTVGETTDQVSTSLLLQSKTQDGGGQKAPPPSVFETRKSPCQIGLIVPIEEEVMKIDKNGEKEDFNSHLNMEDITEADYVHAKRVCKDFEIKKIKRISRFVCLQQYIIVT